MTKRKTSSPRLRNGKKCRCEIVRYLWGTMYKRFAIFSHLQRPPTAHLPPPPPSRPPSPQAGRCRCWTGRQRRRGVPRPQRPPPPPSAARPPPQRTRTLPRRRRRLRPWWRRRRRPGIARGSWIRPLHHRLHCCCCCCCCCCLTRPLWPPPALLLRPPIAPPTGCSWWVASSKAPPPDPPPASRRSPSGVSRGHRDGEEPKYISLFHVLKNILEKYFIPAFPIGGSHSQCWAQSVLQKNIWINFLCLCLENQKVSYRHRWTSPAPPCRTAWTWTIVWPPPRRVCAAAASEREWHARWWAPTTPAWCRRAPGDRRKSCPRWWCRWIRPTSSPRTVRWPWCKGWQKRGTGRGTVLEKRQNWGSVRSKLFLKRFDKWTLGQSKVGIKIISVGNDITISCL